MKKTHPKKKPSQAKKPTPPPLSLSRTQAVALGLIEPEIHPLDYPRVTWGKLAFDPKNPEDLARAVALLREGIQWLSKASEDDMNAVAAPSPCWPVLAYPTGKTSPAPKTLGVKSLPRQTGRKAPDLFNVPANKYATIAIVQVERERQLGGDELPPSLTTSTAGRWASWTMKNLFDPAFNDEPELIKELRNMGTSGAKGEARSYIREGIRKALTEAFKRLALPPSIPPK